MAKSVTMFTPTGVAHFPSLYKFSEYNGASTGKYEVTLILEDTDEVWAFAEDLETKALDKAKEQGVTRVVKMKNPKFPIRKGDDINADREEKGNDPKEEFAGKWVLKARTSMAFPIMIPKSLPVTTKVDGGDLIKLKIGVKPFDTGSSAGFSAYLNGVKLIEKRASSWGDDDDDDYYDASSESDQAPANPGTSSDADHDDY